MSSDAIKPFAAASGYAGWVLMVREGKEPVVKRCSSDYEAWKMITALEERNPEAKVIHLQTNPGDPRELWAQSSRNFWATMPRHNEALCDGAKGNDGQH